jgi:hypothetical protein
MAKAIVIHGPQGCGKTRHAEALRKHYGMARVVDDGLEGPLRWNKPFPDGILILTYDRAAALKHADTFGTAVVDFASAAQSAGIK